MKMRGSSATLVYVGWGDDKSDIGCDDVGWRVIGERTGVVAVVEVVLRSILEVMGDEVVTNDA